MGRSPEMPCAHRSAGPAAPRRMLSAEARAAAPANRMCPASCWNRLACEASMPKWRSCTWAWVQASVAARVRAFGSRCLSAISSSCARSRRDAGPERDARGAAGGNRAGDNAARTPHRAPCPRCPTARGLRAWRAACAVRGRGRGISRGRFRTRARRRCRLRPRHDARPRPPALRARGAGGVASSTPGAARNSVRTNILENAGCATSAACGAEHQLGIGVTSISRVAQRAIGERQPPHFGIVLAATPALRAW